LQILSAEADTADISRKLEQYLGVAKGEINRLDYIITQFLQAIRPAPLQLKVTSLNAVVEKTLELLPARTRQSRSHREDQAGAPV